MPFLRTVRSLLLTNKRYLYNFGWIISKQEVRGTMEVKTAGIIVIGDEVLKGQVADQNVYFLAKKLHLLGIKLCKVSVVPDIVEDIAKEVAEYSSKYDRVITTGGIGPTHDDVTYEGIAAAFQDTLVLNDELLSYWTWFNKDPGDVGLLHLRTSPHTIFKLDILYWCNESFRGVLHISLFCTYLLTKASHSFLFVHESKQSLSTPVLTNSPTKVKFMNSV